MIYLESKYDVVPRYKLSEALDLHQRKIFPWDSKYMEKNGARFVGIFTTAVGQLGQITVISAWPSVDTWLKVDQEMSQNQEFKKDVADWFPLTPAAVRRIMTPAPHSPLK
jgi:hypothetical protein